MMHTSTCRDGSVASPSQKNGNAFCDYVYFLVFYYSEIANTR